MDIEAAGREAIAEIDRRATRAAAARCPGPGGAACAATNGS
ncbi:hypothetical protein L829_0655 [Mycobacteroides abscessus MAB_030201_1075]|uniref:Uncharacterized protein n=1 Tax=Mycobacteroides abscessus MAB_030201_1075 TaxID=1335410 RepID=A0A829PKH5_9MYCO|nr:hypothetical protein L829_0655 [Mycobacteroides abscessus MAB_030201_1075]